LTLDLGEGDEHCIMKAQQRDHVGIQQLLRLLSDAKGLAQVSAQIFGSILGPESLLEGAGSEGGESRSVGFDSDADLKGFGFEHGCRSTVSIRPVEAAF
jgi:hypothetical protein